MPLVVAHTRWTGHVRARARARLRRTDDVHHAVRGGTPEGHRHVHGGARLQRFALPAGAPATPSALHGKEGVAGSSPAEGLAQMPRRKRGFRAPASSSSAVAERLVGPFWVTGLVAVARVGVGARPLP